MSKIDESNYSALQYSQATADTIRNFWQPLSSDLSHFDFTYCKIINNGTRIYISTKLNWTEWYVDNHFQDNIKHLKHYVPQEKKSVSLWSGHENDEIVDSYRANNLWHGFSIHQHHGYYCEYFDFFTSQENYLFPTKCLNNLSKIQDYIKKFQEDYSSIIDHSDQSKLMVSKKWIPFEKIWDSLQTPEKRTKFYEALRNI